MMIIFFSVVTIILLGVGMFKYNLKEQELESLRSLSTKLLDTNHQMYKTLAMGLYYRFKKEEVPGNQSLSSKFIKNNPYPEIFTDQHSFITKPSRIKGFGGLRVSPIR